MDAKLDFQISSHVMTSALKALKHKDDTELSDIDSSDLPDYNLSIFEHVLEHNFNQKLERVEIDSNGGDVPVQVMFTLANLTGPYKRSRIECIGSAARIINLDNNCTIRARSWSEASRKLKTYLLRETDITIPDNYDAVTEYIKNREDMKIVLGEHMGATFTESNSFAWSLLSIALPKRVQRHTLYVLRT